MVKKESVDSLQEVYNQFDLDDKPVKKGESEQVKSSQSIGTGGNSWGLVSLPGEYKSVMYITDDKGLEGANYIRTVSFKIEFNCCYDGTAQLKKIGYFENVEFKEGFVNIPAESLDDWADNSSLDMARKIVYDACTDIHLDQCDDWLGVADLEYKEEYVGVSIELPEKVEEIPTKRLITAKRIPIDVRGIAVLYSPTLNKYLNKISKHDLRMCVRGDTSIYGVTIEECYSRMKIHGFSSEETDVLMNEFNNDELIDV